MNRRVSLKDALQCWREEYGHGEAAMGRHIPIPELYEVIIGGVGKTLQEADLDHLAACAVCARELRELVTSIAEAEAWDTVLLKAAAAGEGQWPKRIPTGNGKYVIELRRNLDEPDKGLITLRVEAGFRDKLEGKKVVLLDGHGQKILQGEIKDGAFSQEVDALEEIDLNFKVKLDTGT